MEVKTAEARGIRQFIECREIFGGLERSDKSLRVPLLNGDIVDWGGVDRLRYHGVLPIKDGQHSRLGEQRINFTFRTAG